jgi:prolyl-tRNA synthetase
LTKPESDSVVLAYCDKLAQTLRQQQYHGQPLQVIIDKKDIRGGEKSWNWIKKGIPLRLEVGPRDIADDQVCVAKRTDAPKAKTVMKRDAFIAQATTLLDEIQKSYFQQAQTFMQENIRSDIGNFAEFTAFFTPKNVNKPEIHGGFVLAKWCENNACEDKIDELKVSIRCLPLKQSNTQGHCVVCNQAATKDAVFAKSY